MPVLHQYEHPTMFYPGEALPPGTGTIVACHGAASVDRLREPGRLMNRPTEVGGAISVAQWDEDRRLRTTRQFP